METTISFTPAELVAICAGILTLIALAEKIAKAVKAMQKPNEDQNARLDAIDEKLDRDNKRLNLTTKNKRTGNTRNGSLKAPVLDSFEVPR